VESRDDPELPAWTLAALSGSPAAPFDAYPLVTVDSDGWPHVALLSWGEVVVRTGVGLMLALWPASTTTRNLERTGQAILDVAGEGGVLHIRLRARRCAGRGDTQLAVFVASIEDARHDLVSYATIAHGVKFELRDPRTIDRWQDVRRALATIECE
jgi:hypothetical protein